MAGFKWVGSIDGSEPIYKNYTVKDTVVLSRGEMCNLETGEADAGATGDTALIGVATHDCDNTDDGEIVEVIANPGAIYEVEDNNVRLAGALLDLATGGMGLAAASNNEFIVWKDSAADEPTQVIFNGTHFAQK